MFPLFVNVCKLRTDISAGSSRRLVYRLLMHSAENIPMYELWSREVYNAYSKPHKILPQRRASAHTVSIFSCNETTLV